MMPLHVIVENTSSCAAKTAEMASVHVRAVMVGLRVDVRIFIAVTFNITNTPICFQFLVELWNLNFLALMCKDRDITGI